MIDLKLKPNTSYDFTQKDIEMITELSKVGYVHMLSSQVCLLSEKGAIVFKDYGVSGKECFGLKLPDNWFIEGVYPKVGDAISITFGVKKI